MKTYKLKDPSGEWIETTAPSLAKARSNFTWRLMRRPYGLYRTAALQWAADAEEAK